MAGDEPAESRSEIEMVPIEKQSPAQTYVQIKDDLTTSPSDKDPNSSRFKVASRFLEFILSFYLVLMLGFVPAVVILVLLLIYFVGLTCVQLIRHGDHYDKTTQLKFVVRFWIWLAATSVAFVVVSTYCVVTTVMKLKHVQDLFVLGLPIENWFRIILYSMALCYIAFLVNMMLHHVPPIRLEHNESGLCFQEAVFEIVDCLLLLLYIHFIIKRIPSLKQPKILGFYAWKWFQVLIIVIITYNVVRLCTHGSVWLFQKLYNRKLDPATMKNRQHKLLVEKLMPREYFVYYCIGLKSNITFILCSILTLLIWVLYFGSHLSKIPQVDKILHLGNQTCISVLVCSILWLSKTWVVLSWEVTAMYTKLRSQILDSTKQLYFLGIIGRHNHDIFKLNYTGPSKSFDKSYRVRVNSAFQEMYKSCNNELYSSVRCLWQLLVHNLTIFISVTDPDFCMRSYNDQEDHELGERKDDKIVKKMSTKKRKITRYDLLMHNRTPTTHAVKQVACYLISAKPALSDNTCVSSIIDRLKGAPDLSEKLKQLLDEKNNMNGAPYHPSGSSEGAKNDESVTQNSSATPIDDNQSTNVVQSSNTTPGLPVLGDDWEYFKQEVLKDEDCSEIFISTWLEKAQNNCLFLANALSSSKEVVDVLNTTVSCLLIGATFIIWLLLTGLATIQVFVLVASPLLAATFIFGETCKTLFQGIMYVYVVHPIHVGDLCSIDDKQLVVKAVGVWITTFCKVEKQGTMEEVTYPNSELASKVVVKNLTDFVWEDNLDISLGSLQKSDAKELKKQIQEDLDLNEKKDVFVPCIHSVAVQEEEDGDFKIIIRLKYKISNIQDWSYTKCKRQKEILNNNADELVRKYKETLKPLA